MAQWGDVVILSTPIAYGSGLAHLDVQENYLKINRRYNKMFYSRKSDSIEDMKRLSIN